MGLLAALFMMSLLAASDVSELTFCKSWITTFYCDCGQGRNEVRWRPFWADRLRLRHLLVKRGVARTRLKLTCSVEFELTCVVSCDQTAVFVSQK